MGDGERSGSHDFNMASRKAEEAAWRRYEAVKWIESLVGPVGFSRQPSEREFISRLRNGITLCHAINKIQPGVVSKVVENHSPSQPVARELQPLTAYQYFENIRNFLVAVEELKLPSFEACDLERDTMEVGSATKIVDCILALKSYYEWKQTNGGNGLYKSARSPIAMHARPLAVLSSDSRRRLDMPPLQVKQLPEDDENQKLEAPYSLSYDLIAKVLAEYMADRKQDIDDNFLLSHHDENMDPANLISKLISSCLDEELIRNKFSKMKLEDFLKEKNSSTDLETFMPAEDVSILADSKCCRACSGKGNCNHRQLFQMQEKEILDLKALLSLTKKEFTDLRLTLETDLKKLGLQVVEMSAAADGYQKAMIENRSLYNMVQDLKGNIRVYCRIRPSFNAETRSVIDYIGDDGSLIILDPSKPQRDGRKSFQFNKVFDPLATQDEVYKDTQPLIRSVMDGYNVCIFAYGQTGSGKTYTMSGPPGGSAKDLGINYLALNDLFEMSKKRKATISYDIHVQMVEIYNEQLRDLLAQDSSVTKLEIRSCIGDNGLSLPDATMHPVKSTYDVCNLMKLGDVNRAVSSTAMNNQSSRSHSVLTVHVHGTDSSSGDVIRSRLHLVDLAGSERVDRSEVTGDRLKEAQYINKSLSCLGDVITALAQKNSHIPYRNSKLTLLLQDSLGGRAKTLMFAHMSPDEDSFGETTSTLKFAQRVSAVELGASRANKESSEIMHLKEQIDNLKKALANKESNGGQLNKVTDQTPPRPRRLSIENSTTTKTEKSKPVIDRTPPRARRLSIEKCSTTKTEKPKAMIDRTPPRARRLSIENCSIAKTEKPKAVNDRTPPRSRRLSSENMPQMRFRAPTLEPPKTPERKAAATNEVQIVIDTELNASPDSRSVKLTNGTNGKGSQIRKSLRTIGKLINGSEKKNRQHCREARSPINGAIGPKSPVTSNARALRRQSLTGISERSRRASLGGKSVDSDVNDDTHTARMRRNALTPPPVHRSTRTTNS